MDCVMGFKEATVSGFANVGNYNTRASRSEYWWFSLFTILCGLFFTVLIAVVADIPNLALAVSTIYGVFNLLLLVCGTVLAIRRLHDVGRSGWWYLIVLTGVGAFVLVYWFCCNSEQETNQWGAVPRSKDYKPQSVDEEL